MISNSICATIILYNPTDDIFVNIDTYINNIDKLFVVDNSEVQNQEITNKLLQNEKIEYIFNNKNLGIASALNIACDNAIDLKYKWILTMDQDSQFIDFKEYIKCANEIIIKEDNIGLITLNHTHDKKYILTNMDCDYEEKDIVITSGNLVNLKYFNLVGRFDDSLFIDMVDFDFSHKVTLNKLKIIFFKNHFLLHELGEIFKRKNLITKKAKDKIEHGPQRVYYMTRNRLYLSQKYRDILPHEYSILKTINILFIHELTKILLYEDQKLKKCYAKILGLIHFIKNRKGRYILG